MYKKKKNNKLIIIFLILILLIISLGYAQISSRLRINGMVFGQSEIRVFFEKAWLSDYSRGNIYIKSVDLYNDTLNFNVNLKYPGDQVLVGTTIKNESSFPVKLKDLDISGNIENDDISIYCPEIDMDNEILQPNEKCKYEFVIAWNEDSTTQKAETINLKAKLNYAQYTESFNGNSKDDDKKTSDEDDKNKEASEEVPKEPEIELPTELTAANYGDKVTNYTANGESDWKIFYKDSSGNVYLMLSNYLPANKIPNNAGLIKGNEYRTAWNNSFPITNLKNADAKFMFSKMTGNGSSAVNQSNENYKATASLLDTTIWSSFSNDTDGYGYKAIGSPTVEMWMKSWNEKNGDNLICTTTENGYRIGTSESNLNVWLSSSSLNGKNLSEDNNLYYPNVGEISDNGGKCMGYWLASPSANGNNSMIRLYCGGDINNYSYDYAAYAIRPVVCLNSNVTLTPEIVDNKIEWTLSK